MTDSILSEKLLKGTSLTKVVIGAALEVHKLKGPGLLESIYEKCLLRELELRGLKCRQQIHVPVEYKGHLFEEQLRVDLLVEDCIIVELKVIENLLPAHTAQLLSYMKLLQTPLGLLINFHEPLLKTGIRRVTLKEAFSTPTSFNSVTSM